MKIKNFEKEAENCLQSWIDEFISDNADDENLTPQNFIEFCDEQIPEDIYTNKQDYIRYLKKNNDRISDIIKEYIEQQ